MEEIYLSDLEHENKDSSLLLNAYASIQTLAHGDPYSSDGQVTDGIGDAK